MLIYSFPRRIVFGLNSIDNIADEIKAVDGRDILVVADPLIGKTEAFAKIKGKLEAAKISFLLYDRVEPEPPLA